jgi:alpha-D-ribose 1-methylphosphonate 5-triphosphate diphosphatase
MTWTRPRPLGRCGRAAGSVAEFPTTVDAGRAARELGLPVVKGAPNVMHGESHSGNVSAAALAELGLLDALASDYLPSGLLAGAFTLARSGLATLPAAVGLYARRRGGRRPD